MTLRTSLSLDGVWEFHFDAANTLTIDQITSWRTAQVPMPWQAQFADLHEATGVGWYRKTVRVPAAWAGRAVYLHCNAVDYYAEVWVNGHLVGSHEGGYLPFEFDVSSWLRYGEINQIVVRAVDPGADDVRFPDFPMREIPHGKQSWYGPLGGIWQSVWMEARSPIHLLPIRITPQPRQAQVTVEAHLNAPAPSDLTIALAIRDSVDQVLAQATSTLAAGALAATLTVDLPGFAWWSPDSPVLYHAQATLLRAGEAIDAVGDTFGFRTIEARNGQILLNGEPIYLRGALDQDYYPGTIATPPSEAFLDDQFRKAKELGLNALRIHIKVGDPRYYRAADRVGLLIWSEIPNWELLTEKTKERARATLEGMIARDWNRPSLIAWSIINEGWGLDLPHDASHRAWLKEMYAYAKQIDPYRLIVDNSACPPNFHIQSDLDDYHTYRVIPDHHREFDAWVEEFAARPDWTYTPFGEGVRSGEEPLVVSEFGNWGLPDADLLSHDGEPWWFETGLEWGDGVVYPHGVQARCRRWGLERIFGSYQQFVTATQWQEYLALKFEIEALRRRASIQGYVITEFTDVHWECNGLLDMGRRPKAFHDVLRRVNADDVLIPHVERWAYWAGETITVRLWGSRFSAADPGAGTVRWWVEGTALQGALAVPPVARGQVAELGQIALPAPMVDGVGGQARTLQLQWLAADGRLIAENDLHFTVFSEGVKAPIAGMTFWSPDAGLAARLRALGWPLAAGLAPGVIAVTRRLDTLLHSWVQSGGRVLLLAEGPQAMATGLPRVHITPRAGTSWQGDWASSFAWLRRAGPFATLPGGPLFDLSFSRVIPEYVIVGLSPWDFEADVDAGLCIGWIHKAAGLIVRRRYGQGAAVVTTLRLADEDLGSDPVATALLQGLAARAAA